MLSWGYKLVLLHGIFVYCKVLPWARFPIMSLLIINDNFHLLLCLVEKKTRNELFEALVSVLKCTSSHTQSNIAYHILSR